MAGHIPLHFPTCIRAHVASSTFCDKQITYYLRRGRGLFTAEKKFGAESLLMVCAEIFHNSNKNLERSRADFESI